MEKIKLVIWDLDDTFWKGTLSEGAVDIIPQNIQIVKELVDRGIMNSIVSKNDYDKAKKQLESFGIWDMFIFPKISWNPKGEIVKQLLEQCKLRPNNTLFVDDNHSNLQEVKFYNPDIQILNATDFTLSILNDDAFKGKDDKSHSRLEQYKILEQRANEETKYSSNIEFLQDSHIKVSIEKDCLNEKDRIAELIQRTNQLNFTKNRISKEELESLLTDKASECRLIRVKDRFGDYGIVGFYALKGDILEHFLFSCRDGHILPDQVLQVFVYVSLLIQVLDQVPVPGGIQDQVNAFQRLRAVSVSADHILCFLLFRRSPPSPVY